MNDRLPRGFCERFESGVIRFAWQIILRVKRFANRDDQASRSGKVGAPRERLRRALNADRENQGVGFVRQLGKSDLEGAHAPGCVYLPVRSE
jgi:hypothetical protein